MAKPCRKGHTDGRYPSGGCIACTRERVQRQRAAGLRAKGYCATGIVRQRPARPVKTALARPVRPVETQLPPAAVPLRPALRSWMGKPMPPSRICLWPVVESPADMIRAGRTFEETVCCQPVAAGRLPYCEEHRRRALSAVSAHHDGGGDHG